MVHPNFSGAPCPSTSEARLWMPGLLPRGCAPLRRCAASGDVTATLGTLTRSWTSRGRSPKPAETPPNHEGSSCVVQVLRFGGLAINYEVSRALGPQAVSYLYDPKEQADKRDLAHHCQERCFVVCPNKLRQRNLMPHAICCLEIMQKVCGMASAQSILQFTSQKTNARQANGQVLTSQND